MKAPQKERLEIKIDPSDLCWLRQEADRRGVSIAAVVREAIRELRAVKVHNGEPTP